MRQTVYLVVFEKDFSKEIEKWQFPNAKYPKHAVTSVMLTGPCPYLVYLAAPSAASNGFPIAYVPAVVITRAA